MRKGLTGKRVAICGTRKTEEISTLIEKQGGIPVLRPLQGTIFLTDTELESDFKKFVRDGTDWIIFTTGIGTEAILNLVERLGIKEQFLKRVHQSNVAIRGYKTLSTLKKIGVKPVVVDGDGTTKGLIQSLCKFDFKEKKVIIQLHGETSPVLINFLQERGASVTSILPYQHIAPELEMVETTCKEIIGNILDAVCFTTAIQVRALFNYAREKDILEDILNSFQEKTLAVAVGKVTAEALTEEGIDRFLVPEHERMGAMIIELSHYYKGE